MRTRFPKKECHRRSAGNVCADLLYRAPENMLVKAQFVSRIAELLAERDTTQTEAGTLLGIPQPQLSKVLRGQFRELSEYILMGCLTKLGQDVRIIVRQGADPRGPGAVSVTIG